VSISDSSSIGLEDILIDTEMRFDRAFQHHRDGEGRTHTVHSRYNVHPDSHKSARLKFRVACIRFAEES